MIREKENGFGSVFVSDVLMETGSLEVFFVISKHPRYVNSPGQVWLGET
jgi:hypothetical protein